MEIGDVVIVKILGSDILNSNYSSVNDCALAKATKRHFETNNVCAGSRTISVGNKDFRINSDLFGFNIFNELKHSLTENQANDVVIEMDLILYKID